jgi:hypothetical protein
LDIAYGFDSRWRHLFKNLVLSTKAVVNVENTRFFDAQMERRVPTVEREIQRFSEKVHTKVHTTHKIEAKKYG